MDTFPWADVNAALAKDTLALIYMDELFGFNRFMEVIIIDFHQNVAIGKRHHRRICVSACHTPRLCPAGVVLARW